MSNSDPLRQLAYDTWCDMAHLKDEAQIDILLAALRKAVEDQQERDAKIADYFAANSPTARIIAARIRGGE